MNYINITSIRAYNKYDMLENGEYVGPDLSGQLSSVDDYYGDRVIDSFMDSYNDYISSYKY